MASFDEIALPGALNGLARGAKAGPQFNTSVVTTGGGQEQRNQNWVEPRRRYEIAMRLLGPVEFEQLRDFFIARRGQLRAFRYRDPDDFQIVDQSIGTGDGAQIVFQIFKRYADEVAPADRDVKKLVAGTLQLSVNGVLLQAGIDYTVDVDTGLVDFTLGGAPGGGLDVRVVYCEFDVPVRFAADYMPPSFNAVHNWDGIELIEVRL